MRRKAAAEKSAAAVSNSKEKLNFPERKGRVCAGNPSGGSCALKINLFGAMRRKAAADFSAAVVSSSKEKHSFPERKNRVLAADRFTRITPIPG